MAEAAPGDTSGALVHRSEGTAYSAHTAELPEDTACSAQASEKVHTAYSAAEEHYTDTDRNIPAGGKAAVEDSAERRLRPELFAVPEADRQIRPVGTGHIRRTADMCLNMAEHSAVRFAVGMLPSETEALPFPVVLFRARRFVRHLRSRLLQSVLPL